jgi:hypothetical protein
MGLRITFEDGMTFKDAGNATTTVAGLDQAGVIQRETYAEENLIGLVAKQVGLHHTPCLTTEVKFQVVQQTITESGGRTSKNVPSRVPC